MANQFPSGFDYNAWKQAGGHQPPGWGTHLAFRHPTNGYVERCDHPRLYSLLFGGFYFAVKGIWTHAIVGFILAAATLGFSWFVYPFFAIQIVRTHYARRGWEEVPP